MGCETICVYRYVYYHNILPQTNIALYYWVQFYLVFPKIHTGLFNLFESSDLFMRKVQFLKQTHWYALMQNVLIHARNEELLTHMLFADVVHTMFSGTCILFMIGTYFLV